MGCYFGNSPDAFAGYGENLAVCPKLELKIDLGKNGLSGHVDFLP